MCQFITIFSTGASFGFDESEKVVKNNKTEKTDDFKGIDFGLFLGSGSSYKFDNLSAYIEARYSFGLSNILDKNKNNMTANTRGIRLSVGMLFLF